MKPGHWDGSYLSSGEVNAASTLPSPRAPIMHRPLHRPSPRTREGDVPALEHNLALPCGQGDAVFGLHADLVGGALDGQVFV